MKTTIDIAPELMERTKRLAHLEKTTFRELVDEGLRLVLLGREGQGLRRVEPVTVGGRGRRPEWRDHVSGWRLGSGT